MSENRVLSRIFRLKIDEVTGVEKLHDEELNDLYSSPKILRVVMSRKVRWECQVARMGRGETYKGFWWGDLRGRDHLRDPV